MAMLARANPRLAHQTRVGTPRELAGAPSPSKEPSSPPSGYVSLPTPILSHFPSVGWSTAVQGQGGTVLCGSGVLQGAPQRALAWEARGHLLTARRPLTRSSLQGGGQSATGQLQGRTSSLHVGPGLRRPLHPTHVLTDLPVAISTADLSPPPPLKWAGPVGPGGDG